MDDRNKNKEKMSLIFVPFPGISHLVSMVELGKTLLLRHHQNHQLLVTILLTPPREPSPQISSYVSSVMASGLGIVFHELPKFNPPVTATQSERGPLPSLFSALMDFQKPNVKSKVQYVLSTSLVAAIVVDMFCVDMLDVAREVNVPCYLYYPSSATMLGLMLYFPTLEDLLHTDKVGKELSSSAAVEVPGFSSAMPIKDIPRFLKRKDEKYMGFLHRYREFSGVIVNSYIELQPYGFRALEEGEYVPSLRPTLPVYAAGPLLSIRSSNDASSASSQHECIQWLNQQPQRSVVFLCFGSMGSFSTDQAREMAHGLERSGHRFLWVLRSPPSENLGAKSRQPMDAILEKVLPEGFLERTKRRGLVWPTFAPQSEILGHKAVGGFVTHCGWNSVLESLWFQIPMLAWPLYAEQHANAFEMVTEMEVAIGLKIDRDSENWVPAGEVERGVRRLMEVDSCEQSRKVRTKVVELGWKGKRALEDGGSSFLSMERLMKMMIKECLDEP